MSLRVRPPLVRYRRREFTACNRGITTRAGLPALIDHFMRWYDHDDYKNFINSPEWRAIRINILIRDKHRCQMCRRHGSKEVHLSVHHKYGYDISTRTKPSLLVTLCVDCHAKHHDKVDHEHRKNFKRVKSKVWDPFKPRKQWETRIYYIPVDRKR